ncbi:MAG: GntR family transcriptional regulator [Rhodospirillaceae bacterium]|nr:GntR family transcriptional regulator [Rhodospirillaceae bacterium]
MGRSSKSKTSPDEIADAIRNQILRGELEPGTPVRQDDLAAEFEVSRVPVREALRSLASEGLMLWQPHQGFRVAQLKPAEAREILEIRSVLEVRALEWAFPHLGPDNIEEARDAIARAEATKSIDEWSHMNGVFHTATLGACGRPNLLALIQQLNNRVDRYIRLLVQRTDYRIQAEREHRAILATIEAGNLAAASLLLEQHIEDTADALDRFLADHRPDDEVDQASTSSPAPSHSILANSTPAAGD